ncbi:SH3 domain-containing protein [Streptomyces sp. MST-110588]|uniref:SH3 domain-containing protein n=1 Tax=Streptomyces sp. MST-110588 TaxID=2833628 RepID=UPI001F5C1B1C|nr:SH3 domain-containing protein [Streptomyces sp. MST-110588]UNO38586.1 SH3 domain-containing protein [Streptomyces sp. MST-110588]
MRTRITAAATLTAAVLAVGTLGTGPAAAAGENNVRDYNTTIWGKGVNLRSGPGTKYRANGSLAYGDKIRVTATNRSCFWYKVKLTAKSKNGLPKGTAGWVNWVYVRKLVDKGTQGC